MTIYTKKGDDGLTSLFKGKRVWKNNIIIEVLGRVDKLSSLIGFVNFNFKRDFENKFLFQIQKDLYLIMSYISGVKTDLNILTTQVKRFERFIDKMSLRLPNLNRFIIPSGSKMSGLFHILRTETRSCERIIVSYFIKINKIKNLNEKNIIKYLNRLSDLFFMLARKYSKNKEIYIKL